MDEGQNSGQFMANAQGGGSPLQEAIARRSGALNQQGAGSATPGVLPSAPPPGSPQMVSNAPSASTGATGGTPQTPERVDDAHIILKAMSARLKAQDDIAKAQSIPPKPTTQA